MQFFILFLGAMVFVFFVFERPPLLFQPVELKQVQASPEYAGIQDQFDRAFEARQARRGASRMHGPDARAALASIFATPSKQLDAAHAEAEKLAGDNDTNYIFLSFVTHYLPVGVVGLVIGVIFSAAMSAISGEINSLATVTVIDIYRRHFRQDAADRHYLIASRIATAFWGIYAAGFAALHKGFGALIEAVNQVGSLFYGGMLGVFVLAFFVKRVGGNGAFIGVLAGEAAIFAAAKFTNIAFLWYNVIGCVVVIGTGLAVSTVRRDRKV